MGEDAIFVIVHDPARKPLLLYMVIMDAGVQARLSAIDARAKLVSERATRKQRNDPSLRHTE